MTLKETENRYDEESSTDSPSSASRVVIPAGIDAGDIILFNRRCLSMPPLGALLCLGAKAASNSRYDHIGLVVKDPNTGELLFLEADFGGVKLRPLAIRLSKSKSNEIALRRLSVVRSDAFRRSMYEFAHSMVGTPYRSDLEELLTAVVDPLPKQQRERIHALLIERRQQLEEIDGELRHAKLTAFQRKTLLSERQRVADNIALLDRTLEEQLQSSHSDPFESSREMDLSKVFCSELVAAAYQHVGLLENFPPAGGYNPKDFSAEQLHPPGVHLLKGARLGPEEPIRRGIASQPLGKTSKSAEEQLSELSARNEEIRKRKSGQIGPEKESRELIKEALKKTPLYSAIPEASKRSHFISSFEPVYVEPGDVIFAQGDYGDSFFIIESGEVERYISREQGVGAGSDQHHPMLVSTLGPGNSFGLTAFLYNSKRTATIRVKSPSVLWRCNRPTFEKFRDTSTDIKVLANFADKRLLRSYLREHFLFTSLDHLGARELDSFFTVHFRAGETIFRQGDKGDNFYIVKKGEVERHINRPKAEPLDTQELRVSTLGPGQSFGELSLMYDAPRGATMKARSDVECWAISSESFHALHLQGGARYLKAVFGQYASIEKAGERYMTNEDFLRFARAEKFDPQDAERMSSLLLALVTGHRNVERAVSSSGKRNGSAETTLIGFWEFVRFDIALNERNAEMQFAFRLLDRSNSGFVGVDEVEQLLHDYRDIDPSADRILYSQQLQQLFGKEGRRKLSYKEFTSQNADLLPSVFRNDVRKLSQHLLNEMEAPARLEYPVAMLEMGSSSALSRSDSLSGKAPAVTKDHLLCVVLSSIISRTAVAPLERLKILMQTESISSTGPRRYRGVVQGLKTIYREEGALRHLFRGNGANVLRIAPASALQILLVELLRQSFPESTLALMPSISGYESALIGGAAGLISTPLTYPLDYLHGRLCIQKKSFEPYKGIQDGIRQTIAKNGTRGLYRGLLPTYLGVFPYVGLNFAVYEHIRPLLPRRNDGSGSPTGYGAVVGGIFASATAQLAAYPFDTLRRRMQVVEFVNPSSDRPRLRHIVMDLIRSDGLRGFYRGWMVNFIKIIPSSLVGMGVYEISASAIENFQTQRISSKLPGN